MVNFLGPGKEQRYIQYGKKGVQTRQEELPPCQVPQLAPRPQRLPDHVHHAQDRQDGQVHGRPRGFWSSGSLSMS